MDRTEEVLNMLRNDCFVIEGRECEGQHIHDENNLGFKLLKSYAAQTRKDTIEECAAICDEDFKEITKISRNRQLENELLQEYYKGSTATSRELSKKIRNLGKGK